MSEIEILQASLDSLRNSVVFGLASMTVGIMAMIFIVGMMGRKIGYAGLVVVVLGTLLMISAIYEIIPTKEELRNKITERDLAYDTELKAMSCDDMRTHIIEILENDLEQHIEDKLEWEKDYYYHKCEIPLRDEVLKLQ